MNKRGLISLAQVFILIFGIVAISYSIGSGIKIISAAEIPKGYEPTRSSTPGIYVNPNLDDNDPTKFYNSKTEKYGSVSILTKWLETDKPLASGGTATVTPATATTPTSLGYGGKIAGFFFGKDSMGQKGTIWNPDTKSWVPAEAGTPGLQSGAGYSVGGILQGAQWAGI